MLMILIFVSYKYRVKVSNKIQFTLLKAHACSFVKTWGGGRGTKKGNGEPSLKNIVTGLAMVKDEEQ